MSSEVALPLPSLLWEGDAPSSEGRLPETRGRWRVVRAHRYRMEWTSHGSAYADRSQVVPLLVIERSRMQDAMGSPVWEREDALPAEVLQVMLQAQAGAAGWLADVAEALGRGEGR